MKTLLTFLVLSVFLVSCAPDREEINRIVQEELQKATRETIRSGDVIGPYSPAVRAGGFLFVSGQIGIDQETGSLVDGGIEKETTQTLDNIMRILSTAGYDSSHVINATVYLRDIADYPRMNLIYGGYFPEDAYPARTTVAVTDLPRGARIEVAVVAWK
jgi:2-iminobutanoate/2-iminopropanoate deaminase